MEYRGSKSKGKRTREDDYNLTLASTQDETPTFIRVLLAAQNFCPFLKLTKDNITREELHFGNWEPLLRKILREDLLPLISSNPGTLAGGSVVVHPSTSSPPRIPGTGGQKLQLCVRTKMPTYLFSEEIIKGEEGSMIYVSLIDLNGTVVQTGPASVADLNVVVLEGDFNEEISKGWERDVFKSHQVKERVGKQPLLAGTLQVKLEGGEGVLEDLSFTDNSSWTRSKKFRLGVELASGFYGGIRVMEGKTNAFRVKHHRGKAYDKRYPPALHDKVWRLNNIGKDGKLDKRLVKAEIRTVEDLLRLRAKDPQRLRTILGEGMTDKMWETTINHAMTFSPSGEKLYVYYTDGTRSSGVMFNHIHEPLGLITDRQVILLESLDQTQKKSRAKKAYENWDEVMECDEQFLDSIRTSKEMQDCPAYSINHNITPTQTGHTFQSVHQIQPQYTYVPRQSPKPPFSSSDRGQWSLPNDRTGLEDLYGERIPSQVNEMPEIDEGVYLALAADWLFGEFNIDRPYEAEPPPVYRTVKAVVGWLKIKAALKLGMMVSI